MEFKVGDIVKVKDIEDLIKRGRCDEKTARHISGVKFIINAFVVKSNQYELKDKTGSTVYCYEYEIEKCENIENESIKNDRKDDKVMMELLPWPELEEVGKVYTAGAKKYGQTFQTDIKDIKVPCYGTLPNWKRVMILILKQDACTRHKLYGMQLPCCIVKWKKCL